MPLIVRCALGCSDTAERMKLILLETELRKKTILSVRPSKCCKLLLWRVRVLQYFLYMIPCVLNMVLYHGTK